jgi:hypothetical protein
MPRCSTHLLPCSCAAALPLEPGQLLNHLPLAAWSRRWCAIGSHPWCASPRSPLADRRSDTCMMPTLCCCMPACWACCAAVDCFLPARPPPARRPQIGAIFSGGDFSQLTFSVNGSTFFYGDFINVLIYFIIVCLVVYFGVGGARRRSACSHSARPPPHTHAHTQTHTHTLAQTPTLRSHFALPSSPTPLPSLACICPAVVPMNALIRRMNPGYFIKKRPGGCNVSAADTPACS